MLTVKWAFGSRVRQICAGAGIGPPAGLESAIWAPAGLDSAIWAPLPAVRPKVQPLRALPVCNLAKELLLHSAAAFRTLSGRDV